MSLVLVLGWRASRLRAALAVRVRLRGAGVRVRVIVMVIVLRQGSFPYSPVDGAEASQQTLVIETTALLPERVLGREDGGDMTTD